ncbi:ComF family protein [Fimbriimonas ginsengisoli]|uniref:Phosphoribosyltransferase n=1 Tax=Fimbriimonas ginsengisoli Gsoil 348 TaxID=661478 RepID=A0A068NTG7_FIMGI|nr:ComF family protein [Fimbriimonas ginsengisoli]AIE86736.1 phosphoribosyltransferase [Fimbriimonas ginsengisoli Gsoil 348]
MLKAGGSWTSFFDRAADLLYPRKCPLCGLFAESSPCPACRDEFIESDPRMAAGKEGAALDYRLTLFRYEGRAGQAVRALKYGRSTSLAAAMSREIQAVIEEFGLDVDAIVPVPIHWSRRCSRGFNQSELLCERLTAQPEILARVRRTRPQAGLSREERERNLLNAFRVRGDLSGQRIMLVDDVLTSGQTARECAKVLRLAGAAEVGIVAFCGDA